MKENNDYNMDESSWGNFFEMAESYENDEVTELLPVYDYIDFEQNMTVPAHSKTFQTADEALKVLFGYRSFREGQKDIIDHILQGRDTFAVMPTGAGKSVCYQIPAMLLPGITLVISPLISLMQDQVKSLNEAGISAAFINSALSEKMFYETVQRARQGIYKLIYVAPERLMTEGFLSLVKSVRISMVTVDEAHCISQWGQDFRPSYTKILEFVQMLDERPIVSAFTATATELVRTDIVQTLKLQNPYILVNGFDRENLFFQVEKPKNKDKYLLDYIRDHRDESGIIYCATRKNVDKVYELLREQGISVGRYHAGLGAEERKKMQNDFVFDYTSIIVATNAFGMGIDKLNVRFVIHYNMPQSMENYYQEAGRAGRDGLDSKCILLFSPQDIVINRFLLEHKELSDLEGDLESIKQRDMQRLRAMETYCYTTDCLRNYILKYFGENPQKPCEDCGNCRREFETLDMTDEAKQVINCVYEMKGRYGKTLIIDTVCGASTVRIREIGAANYKTYGVLAKSNRNLLRRLIEQMIFEGYLQQIGDYQVINLGDITPLRNSETRVLVKIMDEDKLPKKPEKQKTKNMASGMGSLTPAGVQLFEKLRKLRLDIARKQNMPPYIVFNDRTLIDMAMKVPASKDEMLNVSGVGDNKYQKYGEIFLETIQKYKTEHPEILEKKQNRQPINISIVDNFVNKEYMYVSEIKDEINRICEETNLTKTTVPKLMEILLSEGLLVKEQYEGQSRKMFTEKGRNQGIEAVEKISARGDCYIVLRYPENIQRMLTEEWIRKCI